MRKNPTDFVSSLALPSKKRMQKGFRGNFENVCKKLATKACDFDTAKKILGLAFDEFKNTPANCAKRNKYFTSLEAFNNFLNTEGLISQYQYSKLEINFSDNLSIFGQSLPCALNNHGEFFGIFITETGYDFARSLRLPFEQEWISQKFQVDFSKVNLYIFNCLDNTYQKINYSEKEVVEARSETINLLKVIRTYLKTS